MDKAEILYESDQSHSEIVVREMDLEGAKAAPTAGTRKEQKAASVLVAAFKVEVEDESPELNAGDARAYRGVAARCNYIAQDRVDRQYASKEASWRMGSPRLAD